MKVWLVFVDKQVRHVCKTAPIAIKRLANLKDKKLDAWCMEKEIEEE